MPSSNGIFKFELEQNVDYWLANTKYVYCVCDVGDEVVLIQVRNDISTICIGIEKGIPVQYGHGDLNSPYHRFDCLMVSTKIILKQRFLN